MSSRGWITVILVLAIIILVLIWLLFTTPAQAPTLNSPQATSSVQTVAPSGPSTATSSKAVVTSPSTNAKVAHTFTVSGSAPSTWYFEAVFPIQVRDSDDNLIATAQARAQSDWTKPGMIPFTALVTIDASASGPATLIVLKDNPSGDPENADEVTVPIIIR